VDILKLKKIKTEYISDATLSQNEINHRKERLIKDTREILDRIMNPASHGGCHPLYNLQNVIILTTPYPLKFGLRFSRKAVTPSVLSSDAIESWNPAISLTNPLDVLSK